MTLAQMLQLYIQARRADRRALREGTRPIHPPPAACPDCASNDLLPQETEYRHEGEGVREITPYLCANCGCARMVGVRYIPLHRPDREGL